VSGPTAEARFVKETGAAAGIAALAEPVLESLGYRLVLARILQGQGTIVEIMAERPDGSMTIDDCRAVSLALSPVLDVHDPVSGSYRLQISSPGIDRPLVRPADFDRWAGFEARIELKEPIDGRRRFRGILEGFEDGEVRIEVDLGAERGGIHVIGLPLDFVGEAKLMLTDDLVRESLRRTKRALAEAEAGSAEGTIVPISEDEDATGGSPAERVRSGPERRSPPRAGKARGPKKGRPEQGKDASNRPERRRRKDGSGSTEAE
jgi:ribosome maturation factor RimP